MAAAAFIALLPLGPASAGTADDPEVTDPVGDANVLSVQRSDVAAPISADGFDITKAWFAGNGVVTIELAGLVPISGTFAVQFDTAGCVYPTSEPLAVDPPVDQHVSRGVSLALDLKPPAYTTAYYLCNADSSLPLTAVSYRISGRTITLTVPRSGWLRAGAPIIAPFAYSVLGYPNVDITAAGRDAVL
jgi:hypothetical protein